MHQKSLPIKLKMTFGRRASSEFTQVITEPPNVYLPVAKKYISAFMLSYDFNLYL